MYRLADKKDALSSVPKTFLKTFKNYHSKDKGKNKKDEISGIKSSKVSPELLRNKKSSSKAPHQALKKCNKTWSLDQVNFESGPSGPTQALYAHGLERGHGHKKPLDIQGHSTSVFYYFYNVCKRLITLGNDIETNPGPNILVKTYNVSGMREYDKLKRILNFCHKTLNEWLGVVILQETHLTETDQARLNIMWKGKFVMSPGSNQARGCTLLYADWHFEKVILTKNDNDGRTTWLIASKEDEIHLFLGIYAPNKRQDLYFKGILDETQRLIESHNVTRITLAGDLNTEIVQTPGRYTNPHEAKAKKMIVNFMNRYNLQIISDTNNHTWCRRNRRSTIDYICSNIEGQWNHKTKWGIDKSDHGCVEAVLKMQTNQGPGIPRIDPTFLEYKESREQFLNNIQESLIKAPCNWDPHQTLEFMKVCIRSEAFHAQGLMKKEQDIKLKELRQALDEKMAILRQSNNDNTVLNEIESIKLEIEEQLEIQAKRLAQRARMVWIEKGERNNRYFLNIIKNNRQKQAINTIYKDDGTETNNQKEIKSQIHKFYSKLFTKENNDIQPGHAPERTVRDDENRLLTKTIRLEDLQETLKKAKGTTPGPDGIPNEIYKWTWKITGPIIIKAWEHSLATGHLAPSQKESAICLLDKKGKDRRHIGNLRPITLSNCDLKLITKTYTTRINTILGRILCNNQTAYLKGRQVHDGLRLIDLYKEHFTENKTEGYLVGLDARKAYDSVDHNFIAATLAEYGFNAEFIKIFRILYNDIVTKVIVNGHLTDKIEIGRGVKQGDALSCSLFILLMDKVIRDLNNSNIQKVNIGQNQLTNTIGYADDLAVVVTNKEDLQKVFEVYEKFSKQSGLYLNADKTEILNLRRYDEREHFIFKVYNKLITIQAIKSLKICGKTFSCDPEIEHENNVNKPIEKAENEIMKWSARNLSTDGRILVAKTFGLSQVIYQMQNTHFEPTDIKKLERIIYRFIWNGPDKIKRTIIQGEYKEGGLKAPNIEAMNKTLKLKQVLRAALSNHDIKHAQKIKFDGIQPIIKSEVGNRFIKVGVNTYNMIGKGVINNVLNDQGQVHKDHLHLLGKTGIIEFLSCTGPRNILKEFIVSNEMKHNQVKNLSDLADKNIRHGELGRILEKIPENYINRIKTAQLDRDETTENRIRNKIPIKLNVFREIRKIKHRELLLDKPNKDASTDSNPFCLARKIKHPKERMRHYMALQKKTYTNEKLCRLQMTNSDKCATCINRIETLDHILHECPRSETGWKIYEHTTDQTLDGETRTNGPSDIRLLNVYSLVKNTILIFRDLPINEEILKYRCQLRMKDLACLNRKRKLDKHTRFVKHSLFDPK